MEPDGSTPDSFETALNDAAWLRTLAVQLVGAKWAEDVVQDTYLAALRRADEPRNWRAWLTTVARRAASNTRRRERRQSDLKARVADEGLHAAEPRAEAALQERLLVQRRLLQAISELEPQDGDVVMRCYLDGLTPAAVALELGIPASTVRSRLARALAKLRAKLDDELGAERWLGALLPWVGPWIAPPGLPHTLPPPNGSAAALSHVAPIQGIAAGLFGVIGGVSVAKWMGAVVLAVVGVLVWQLEFDSGMVDTTQAAVSSPVERAVVEPPASSPRAVADEPSALPSNRVVVQASSVKADPAVVAQVPALRTADFIIVDGLTQRPLADVELVVLDPQRMTAQLGEIKDDFGSVEARSDANGALHYSYSADSYSSCLLRRAGYSELFLSTSFLGDNGSEYALEMWPARNMTVRVIDAQGVPVVGAAVNVLAETDELAPGLGLDAWGFGFREDWDGRLRRSAQALTNEFGETALVGFREKVSLRLEVWVAGALAFSGKEMQVVEGRVEIRLPARHAFIGVLRDSLGAPLANIGLFLGAYDNVMPVVMSTTTDAFGRFEFNGVPMGEDGGLLDWVRGKDDQMQTMLPTGELLSNTQLDWKAAVDGVLEVELRSEPAFSISGAVFKANGALVETDGFVWVQRDGLHVATELSHDGQFLVPGLARGEYWLSFSIGGGAYGKKVVAQAGDEGVRLEAMESANLTLKLVPAPGSPAGTKMGSNVMVIGYPDQGGMPLMTGSMFEPQTFKAEQKVDFTGCAPGLYRFVVRGMSGMIGYADVEVLAGVENLATVSMQPEARVAVVLPEGVYDEVRFLIAGREVGWQDRHEVPAVVPPGAITVTWLREDGTLLETTVVAIAGETVTAHFD